MTHVPHPRDSAAQGAPWWGRWALGGKTCQRRGSAAASVPPGAVGAGRASDGEAAPVQEEGVTMGNLCTFLLTWL